MTGNTTGNTRDLRNRLLHDFSRTIELVRAQLLDISGRKVMELVAGENDVSRLAPGVYFVREASGVAHDASSAVTKVVVPR